MLESQVPAWNCNPYEKWTSVILHATPRIVAPRIVALNPCSGEFSAVRHILPRWHGSSEFDNILPVIKHSIEILLERIASWPDEAQDEFVKSLADMKAGRLASDDAVAAMFSRCAA